jgi:rRNA-processing protein FCF1
MSSIVIDTNPLAYIYGGIPDLGKKYAVLLGDLSKTSTLLIPKIVYGELSVIFRNETMGFAPLSLSYSHESSLALSLKTAIEGG